MEWHLAVAGTAVVLNILKLTCGLNSVGKTYSDLSHYIPSAGTLTAGNFNVDESPSNKANKEENELHVDRFNVDNKLKWIASTVREQNPLTIKKCFNFNQIFLFNKL